MAKINEKDLLDILFELTHIKNEEGKDVPNFCFASDISVDADMTEEDIAVLALKNNYQVYKVFPGETMLGGLVLIADGATKEPVENMYKEFYGEIPEISELKLDGEDNLIEVEEIKEEYFNNNSVKEHVIDILDKYDDEETSRLHIFEVEPEQAEDFYVEKFDDGDIDFSQFSEHTQSDGKSKYYSFMITGGLNGSGDWTDYLDDIKSLFRDFKKDLGLKPVLYKVDTDIADDVWTGKVFLYEAPTDSQLKESLIKEDFDLHPVEITDEDRFGDIEAFKNEYKRKAEELGASIEFHTKVGPKRLDSSWYRNEDIATIKYKDYIINIFGLSDDVYITWNDEDIEFEDFESYGIYNDETIPEYEDMGYSGIEFTIKQGDDGEPYSSYGDLDFETMWDLESALDIKSYIDDVIPVFENEIGRVNESKNKRPKIRVRDPNAEAMWGRTRHKVELPKKGKGSFKRHPKHKVDEAYFTPEPDDVEHFTELLKQNGWTIESIHEEETYLDDAKKVHIQVIDNTTFPVEVPENATDQEKYEAHRRYCDDLVHADEVWGRADELAELIYQFDPERKYRITYSSSFGGTSHTGIDCTGKITAGIDLRPYMFNDEFNTTLHLGEGKKKKTRNPLKDAAEKHKKSNSRKHAMGWFIMPNVEQSIQAFNHANNAPGAESTITAPAGLGEDLDLAITDNYAWDFDSVNKYLTVNYRFDDATGRYTNDKYYFARIPETAFKVSRDEYKTNKLLKKRKNKRVLDGVEKFFAEHPKSKWCIISCRDISRSEPGRFVNAYRVLDEDLELIPTTLTNDGYVRAKDFEEGSSFILDGVQAEAFIDDLVPYLIDNLSKTRAQQHIELWNEYDIRVINSYNETKEDERGFIELEKDDKYVYITVTPNVWLDAVADVFMPIEDFKKVFAYVVDVDRIPDSIPGQTINPDIIQNVNESVCTVLEKVEKHDTLNPKLWDENNQLKPEVREKILEIVKDFTDNLEDDGIKFKVKDIVLVGSNCSYNYNEKSDLDIHIRMDTNSLECPDNLYPLLYGAYRALYNNKMDIDFYGIPVEIYIETDDTKQLNDEPGEGIDKPE